MPLTSLDCLAVGKPYPFACEAKRMKAYTDGRALLSGDHSDVFGDIVKLMRRDGRPGDSFVQLATPKRIVKAFNGLVFGEPPEFKAKGVSEADDGEAAQEQMESYIEEMDLLQEAHQSLTDVQSLGDGVLKVTLADKGVAGQYPDINAVDPCIWYPVVSERDKQDITAHILCWTWERKEGGKTVVNIRAEVHEPGTVTTWLGTVEGGKFKTLALEEMLDAGGLVTANPSSTGVDECLVVPMFNFRSSADCTGVSDFADLSPILQEITVRLYLIASILDKHSDPKLAGPRSLVAEINGENVVPEMDYIPLEDNEAVPQYVTWEGQLTAAWHEVDFLTDQALFAMEASRALFGDITGNVTSGAALKRLLIAPLLKASVLRGCMDIGLKKALRLASLLHNTVDPSAIIFEDVDIVWNDGLPDDELEQMTIHAGYVVARLESREDAIRALFKSTGAELEARIARLDAEVASMLPARPPLVLPSLAPMPLLGAPDMSGAPGAVV